jgi:transcriptional regulator with XRE-family HTH domain
MTTLRESTARTRELGSELRRIREEARYTAHELAKKLGWSPSKVSRMETGDRNTTELEVAVFVAFCGVLGDDLARMLDPRGDRLPDELRSLIILEATAQILVYYEPIVIPGLVQTEDYARALFHETEVLPADAIEPRIRMRMERQRFLRRERPPKVTFFVHENALRMRVGDSRTMHEQMLHLLLTGAAPPCQLRVVPTSVGARTGAGGPFTWTARKENNPVIYVEHLTTSLFLEGREDMLAYRRRLDRLTELALNEGESREFLANLASEYEREVGGHDYRPRSGPDLA